MARASRNTGISVIVDLPWGTHLCHFYETKQDLLDTLSGRTVGEIADLLSRSSKTISTHRAHILEKMGMETNSELTHYAIRNNLINEVVRDHSSKVNNYNYQGAHGGTYRIKTLLVALQ